MCDLMICGTTTTQHTLNTHTKKIYCPYCNSISQSQLVMDKKLCTFFFIPCVEINESKSYTICKNCGEKIGNERIRTCDDCFNVVIGSEMYCGRCGRKQEMEGMKKNEMGDEMQTDHEMDEHMDSHMDSMKLNETKNENQSENEALFDKLKNKKNEMMNKPSE